MEILFSLELILEDSSFEKRKQTNKQTKNNKMPPAQKLSSACMRLRISCVVSQKLSASDWRILFSGM